MKNLFKKSLPLLSILILTNLVFSCSHPVSSPAIGMFNLSDNYIKNIEGTWNGESLVGHMNVMEPGNNGSENFILKHPSDLFGPVHLEWENSSGQKIVKEFVFKKEQLPNFHNYRGSNPNHKFGRTTFDNIYLFFGQNDVEIFVERDGGDEPQEVKEKWKQANKFNDEYRKICPRKYGCDLK